MFHSCHCICLYYLLFKKYSNSISVPNVVFKLVNGVGLTLNYWHNLAPLQVNGPLFPERAQHR